MEISTTLEFTGPLGAAVKSGIITIIDKISVKISA